MDLIWGHISPEAMRYPELKNIGLTLWPIRKTSFLFSGHVHLYLVNQCYHYSLTLAVIPIDPLCTNLHNELGPKSSGLRTHKEPKIDFLSQGSALVLTFVGTFTLKF